MNQVLIFKQRLSWTYEWNGETVEWEHLLREVKGSKGWMNIQTMEGERRLLNCYVRTYPFLFAKECLQEAKVGKILE